MRLFVLLTAVLGSAALGAWLLWAALFPRAPSLHRVAPVALRAPEPEPEPLRAAEPPMPVALSAQPPPAISAAPGPALPADDDTQLNALRALLSASPEQAIAEARLQSERFPQSANGAERASILIHALAATGQASEARGEAEGAVNHYPDGAWVREIEAFTGAHRHRTAYLTPDGQVAHQ